MPSDLDLLRTAPLPDSFDRTADWLRHAPPPRSGPARPLLLAVALAAVVGACAVPVATEAVVGYAIEAVVADERELIRALDAAVPAENRVRVDVEAQGDASVVRYVVLDPEAARRAEAAAERVGTQARTVALDGVVRQSIAARAARWLGVSASPRVSDADLQLAFDRAFAGRDVVPRIRRNADGQRALDLNEDFRIDRLDPETRVSRIGEATSISGGDLSGLTVGDVPVGELLRLDEQEQQTLIESAVVILDSLSRDGSARVVPPDSVAPLSLETLEALFGPGARADSTLRALIRLPDE